ncbi:MAG: hypothetical protein QOD25_3812, partial [Alphaproteobacteria bacterium]|nr:hypothetical protein [Alphaproteobacteria bacterium]
ADLRRQLVNDRAKWTFAKHRRRLSVPIPDSCTAASCYSDHLVSVTAWELSRISRCSVADHACITGQLGRAAPEKPAERHGRCLSRDIPKGDVDRRDGKGKGAAPSKDVQLLVNVQHQRFDPRCILAVLVRPDGVVAWAGESAPDYEEAVQAASCWLGDPRGA